MRKDGSPKFSRVLATIMPQADSLLSGPDYPQPLRVEGKNPVKSLHLLRRRRRRQLICQRHIHRPIVPQEHRDEPYVVIRKGIAHEKHALPMPRPRRPRRQRPQLLDHRPRQPMLIHIYRNALPPQVYRLIPAQQGHDRRRAPGRRLLFPESRHRDTHQQREPRTAAHTATRPTAVEP